MAWQEACEGEKGGFDVAYTAGADRGRRAEGVVDGIFFARGGCVGWSCGGERKANAGADARTERRKVDQIFVSTPFFLGVEKKIFMPANLPSKVKSGPPSQT
jgi:hypothetical protein